MAKKKTTSKQTCGCVIDFNKPKDKLNYNRMCCHCSSGVYGLGFIGAAIYFISTATGFLNGVLGFLKAVVWPAFLVYGFMKSLGM
ncbi:MAG: hypothetical protein ABIH53_04505 [archaeon]